MINERVAQTAQNDQRQLMTEGICARINGAASMEKGRDAKLNTKQSYAEFRNGATQQRRACSLGSKRTARNMIKDFESAER